jgi:phosphatidate cytidylyltransferase
VDNLALRKRIFNSVIILALVGIITFYCPNWVFSGLASIMIGIALYEFFTMVGKKGIFVWKYFGIIIGMMVPFIVHYQMGTEGYLPIEPFFIVIACFFTFVLQFLRRDNSEAVTAIAVTMFGLLYIAWFLSFFIKIKFLANGSCLVAFIVLVTKMSDVGAYFIGTSFGRRHLIPRISPKKTVEGFYGGCVFSVLTAILGKLYLPGFSYSHLITLGVLMGILAQVGDLAESLLKRDCGAKDSGKAFSGLGGVMDMLDSLFFTVPIFYFYLKVVMK